MNEHFFIYNNQYFRLGDPVISAQNRSFRYGDGLFETMRFHAGRIFNVDFHFERLFSGMKMLGLQFPDLFSLNYFIVTVNQLLIKNSISSDARIRLMFFGGNEGVFEPADNPANFVIEVFPLSGEIKLNEQGLKIDIFPGARKSTDCFSNIKSNNYLPSVMAARFAIENEMDDALILNCFERVCESSIANLFIIIGQNIFTPPLSEGCVAGVMRRFLLEKLLFQNFTIEEKALTVEDLLSADELFLTNSIQLIKWVEQFRSKKYESKKVKKIFARIIEHIS